MPHTNIEYDPAIHNRARMKLKQDLLQRQYIEDCVAAGICPKCGKKLMVKFAESKENLTVYCSDRGCTFIK